MAQKTRKQLQDLFKQGAKPSGDDFTDFVESTFNIKDDGLEKPVGADAPLKIISYGAEENLLDFYTGNSHSWRLNQKPSAAETDGLNFENAGSSKLFIASSGNVGVSTTSPNAKLHILQSGNEDALRIDDANNDTTPFLINKNGQVGIGITDPKDTLDINGDIRIRGTDIKDAGGTARITLTDNGRLDLKEKGGATSLSIAIDGKVGIGTTSPGDKLDINGDIRIRGADIKDAGGTARITLTDNGRLDLKEKGGATSLSIATDGKVGIGTTSPAEKLDVSGTVKATLLKVNGAIEVKVDNADSKLRFEDPGDAWYSMGIDRSDGKKFKLNYGENVGSKKHFIMTSYGNVGIGTTSPSEKLEVSGNAKVSGKLYVNNTLSVPGGEENLRMMRGIINTNGSVRKGGGFSSNRVSTGLYDITFNTKFSDNPAASVTQIFEGSNKTGGDTKDNAIIVYIDENYMRVKTGGSNGIANSRTFTFIVIGPR